MRDDAEPSLEGAVIELADTRPDMIWLPFIGAIPVEIAALIFGVAGLCVNFLGIKWGLWAPLAWFGLSRVVARDYHGTTRIMRWLEVSAWTFDRKRHRGTSASPLPLNHRHPRGLP